MIRNYLIVCGGAGEQVLGQRSILGLDGEIQIDFYEEIQATREKIKLAQDPLSLSVPLDVGGYTLHDLITLILSIARSQKWNDKDIKTVEFFRDNYLFSSAMGVGKTQSPAICGLAISQPKSQELLSAVIRRMIHETAVGGDDLVFWIVSSTAGGTGEGIHRAVAKKIIEIIEQANYGCIKFQNIRVGLNTYKSVIHNKGVIQTLLGICADVKFKETIQKLAPWNLPLINWIYMDLPDFGSSYEADSKRGTAVSIAVKTLMSPEIAIQLDNLEMSTDTILIRTGYWNREYEDPSIFALALSIFIYQLENLINPNNEFLLNYQEKPEFQQGEGFKTILSRLKNKEEIVNILDKTGWNFSRESQPRSIEELDLFLYQSIRDLNALSQELNNYKQIQPQPIFTTEKKQNQGSQGSVFQAIQTGDWYIDYQNAQSVISWVINMLGISDSVNTNNTKSKQSWYYEDRLLAKLMIKQKECAKIFKLRMLFNINHIASRLIDPLSEYVDLLIQCRILVDEYLQAKAIIKSELKPLIALDYSTIRRNYVDQGDNNVVSRLVLISNLLDIIDHLHLRTWFDLVFKTIQENDISQFRNQILKGAIGLTEAGLIEVLGLPPNSAVDEIITELDSNLGRSFNSDGQLINPIWINCLDPHQQNCDGEFNYRLLPKLESRIEEILFNEHNKEIEYKRVPLGMLGINVIAIEGLVIANRNNKVITPSFLIKPLIPYFKHLLQDWGPHYKGEQSARLQVISAGVRGDPLPLEVLQEAGLSDEEINKLSEYYSITKFE